MIKKAYYSCLISIFLFSCRPASQDPIKKTSDLFSEAVDRGKLQAVQIDEASGLVVSRSNPEYLWTHNDSGGENRLYLISNKGQDFGSVLLEGAINIDWEDIALGAGPQEGTNYLYVGDIGDNSGVRESLTIYRLKEPDLFNLSSPLSSNVREIETIEFQYPDGPRDAETLMVDPITKDIIIVTKREEQVKVYALPFPQSVTKPMTAKFLISIPFTRFVGGDISPDGSEILIKTYDNVFYWQRNVDESIREAFSKEPLVLKYEPEPQGEAIAWAPNARSYFTLSEKNRGITPVLYQYMRAN